MIKKIEKCPKCDIENPPLTLSLVDPRKYDDENNIPDSRVYDLICLNCGEAIDHYQVDNTIIAIKELRDEMDKHYDKSRIIPQWI